MKTPRISRLYALLSLTVLLAAAWRPAAAQVTVSFTLRPPYSSAVADYYHLENKAVIVLTNGSSTALDVKLGGSITNEQRGVYVRSNPDWQPAAPITLAPFGTVTLVANAEAMRFFDQANATTNANDAMLANIVRTGQLPEGTYTICVDAYDYRSGRLLSSRGTNCFSFQLSALDPPIITFPQPDHTYPAEQAAKNFSWTPPLGNLAGALVEYDQIVVQVQPGQNPNDAIAAARDFNAGNPVLNKRGLLAQTYVTQPYDLPFEDGGLYAMQVVARDRNGKLLLENGGRSEVITFRIGNTGQPGPRTDLVVADDRDIPEFYRSATLSGTLKAYWPITAQGNAGGAQFSDSSPAGKINSNAKNIRVRLVLAWQIENEENNQGGGFLLPGGLIPPTSTIEHYEGNHAQYANDYTMKTLATATTNADGGFFFNVVNTAGIDFSARYGTLSITEIGGFVVPATQSAVPVAGRVSGMLRRVLAVVVDDVYHAHPVQFKTEFPQNGHLGTFYSRIKNMNIKIRVQDEVDRSARSGIEVLLLRKVGHRPATVPQDELSPGNFAANPVRVIGGQSYEVLAKRSANSQGEATFQNLVFFNYYSPHDNSSNPYDRYYAYADPEESNFSLKEVVPVPVFFDFDGLVNPLYGTFDYSDAEIAAFNKTRSIQNYSVEGILATLDYTNHYVVPPTLYTVVNTQKTKPRLVTTVRNEAAAVSSTALNRAEPGVSFSVYKINRSGMEQAKHGLGDNWGGYIEQHGEFALGFLQSVLRDQMTLERSGTTGDDGKIDVRGLSSQWALGGSQQIGFYRLLMVKKAGFGTKVLRAKPAGGQYSIAGDMQYIAHGETYQMNDVEIRPLGSLFVRLVNERGEPVAGYAYYHDPASGQDGKAKSGMMTQGDDGSPSYIIPDMHVPTGRVAIVVKPTSTSLYARDTFMVDVPAGQQPLITLQVKYRLHRIYFNVWSQATGFARPVKGAKVSLMEMTGNSAILYNDLHSPYIDEGTNLGGPLTLQPRVASGVQASQPDAGQPQVQSGSGPSMAVLGPYDKLTNTGGGVDFAFRNAGTDFKFRITSPTGEISYVTVERNVNSSAGKQWKREDVEVKAGRKVTGTVKLGQVPVAGATVRVLDVEPRIEATTDADGRYELNGVPIGVKLRFSASKMGSGYVGMEYDEARPAVDLGYGIAEHSLGTQLIPVQGGTDYVQPVTYIHFKLRIYKDLDLTKLLGFPLEVTALKETAVAGQLVPRGGGTADVGRGTGSVAVEISGFVRLSDSLNTVFKLNETNTNAEPITTIRFERKLVVADDVRNEAQLPYCRPQTLPLRTVTTVQNLSVFDFYNAKMRDHAGIGLNKLGTGQQSQGAAEGKVTIELTSFVDNNIGLPDGQLFYLAHRNGNQTATTFPVFTSSGTAVVTAQQGIGLSDANGGAIHYWLHGLDARAAAHTSKLHRDSMVLDTRLQTALQYVDNPNLDLPIGSVTIGGDRELEDVDRAIDATTTMGSFSIGWNHIRLSSSQGGAMLNGTINAAGMNLPFRNAALSRTQFQVPDGSLDADNIRLLDHIEVQVQAPASFGYEAARNAWVVAIYEAGRSFSNPSAAFGTAQLQGFPANRTIPISSIYLYSDDTRDINLYNSGNYLYRLHDIVDFHIDNILPAQDILKMPGTLNLGIPNFPSYSSAVQYDKVAGGVSGLSFQHFDMHPVSVNGVVMGFDPGSNTSPGNPSSITFAHGRLTVKGTVSDENPEVFRGIRTTLTKTNQLTELVIDEPTGARQLLPLGGANTSSRMILREIAGKMSVVGGRWNHLYIDGDMPEDMGFTADGKRMRFQVLGALKVDGQQVKLKDISTPFGNINLAYDLANHRLSGGLQVGGNAGGASFSGAINMVIDRSGYYFMSGLSVSLPSPKMEGMGFLLIGDYGGRTVEMDALLTSYSQYIQRKLKIVDPARAATALSLLSQNPQAGIDLVRGVLGGNYLPVAYTRLFRGGPFNGFYFNAGASIPIPLIPSFELDLSPIAEFGMSVNMGADVRFGANFGAQDTYGVGFSVFLDAYFGGGANAGLLCVYGRIGAMIGVNMDGVFSTGGNYTITGSGDLALSGFLRVGGGACGSPQCDDITCPSAEIGGTVQCGVRGTFTNSSTDFDIYLVTDAGLGEKSVHEPPPAGNQ